MKLLLFNTAGSRFIDDKYMELIEFKYINTLKENGYNIDIIKIYDYSARAFIVINDVLDLYKIKKLLNKELIITFEEGIGALEIYDDWRE